MSLEKLNLDGIISAAAKANPRVPGDFMQDGLLYCGKCKTPKQCRVTVCGEGHTVPCMCDCREQAAAAEKAADEARQKALHVAALRTAGLMDASLRPMRFDTDDLRARGYTDKGRRYIANWGTVERDNVGMLLWGNTGTGKTFLAACIANALIDQGVSVMMTSFPRILAAVQGLRPDERAGYLDDLNRYRLLVIDDLGAERQSEYALEIVYNVIDGRYKAQKPLIVTTNTPLIEMQKAQNMDYQRIYDRVLAMCVPIKIDGESRRKGIAAEKMKTVKEIFE